MDCARLTLMCGSTAANEMAMIAAAGVLRRPEPRVSDYQPALKAWQAARNAPGEPMPEAFRIGPALNRDPAHAAAIERVRAWTRQRFRLAEETAVLVAQVSCSLPGCPPLETVVAFWTGDVARHQFKLFKPVTAVVPDDLPPAWMKDALVVDEESGFECC